MAQINPYLAFGGNCREAMTFYQSCFGGDLDLRTFKGSPMESQVPPEASEQIMHARLTNGTLVLMASDGLREAPAKGNTITMSVNCTSDNEITTFFNKLSEGGTVTLPLGD